MVINKNVCKISKSPAYTTISQKCKNGLRTNWTKKIFSLQPRWAKIKIKIKKKTSQATFVGALKDNFFQKQSTVFLFWKKRSINKLSAGSDSNFNTSDIIKQLLMFYDDHICWFFFFAWRFPKIFNIDTYKRLEKCTDTMNKFRRFNHLNTLVML